MNDISYPIFSNFCIDNDLEWQMSRAEKYSLIEILSNLKPDVSLEIGTFMGGSLQVISKFSKNVYSIDISSEPKKYLSKKFNNVEFIVGDSSHEISKVLNQVSKVNRKVEFILIDGDHSKKAVKNDLKKILEFNFIHPLTIILHDSFNPSCRRGIKSINFKNYNNVEYVDLDYVTGSFSPNKNFREMWGGFCLIKINPFNKQQSDIFLSQNSLYRSTYFFSVHILKDIFFFVKPLKKIIYKLLNF